MIHEANAASDQVYWRAGRLSAVVFKLELELKELKSKSFSSAVTHLKPIDTSAQDAIRLATLSRKAAAAGEAADTAQQQLRDMKQQNDIKLLQLQQHLDTFAAEKSILQREAASSLAEVDLAQQQLRDADEMHAQQQADLQQQLEICIDNAQTLEQKAATAQNAAGAAQQQLQEAGEENEQRLSVLQQQLSDALAQVATLKQEIETNSKSHARQLAAQQQDQSTATAAAAERFDSSTSALKAEHANAVMMLQAKAVSNSCLYSSQLATLKLQHEQQLDAVRQQNAQSISAAQEQHQQQLNALKLQNDRTTAAAQEQHQQQLNALRLQNDRTTAAARAESAGHAAAVAAMQSELCSVKRQLQLQECTHHKTSRPFEPHVLGLIHVPAVERLCKGHEAALGAIQSALEVTQAKYAAAKVHSLQDMSTFSAVQMQLYTDLKHEADGLASAQSRLQQAYKQQPTPTSPVTAAMRQLPAPLSFRSAPSPSHSVGPQLRSTADDSIPADNTTTCLPPGDYISSGSRLTPEGVSLTSGGSSHYPTTSIPPVQPLHGSDAGHLIIPASVNRQSPASKIIHASASGQSQGSSYKGFLSSACDSAAAAAQDLASALQRRSCGETAGKTVAPGSKNTSVKVSFP